MKTQGCGLAMLVILVGAISVHAAELKVPSQYSTIQAAIDAANSGDTVLVADGTYSGEGNRDIDFKGKAITVKSQSGPAKCIIDSQGTDTDLHRGFIFQSSETRDSVLDGFTITGGYITGDVFLGGSGIFCKASSPTIRNCWITDNKGVITSSSDDEDSGLYLESSSALIRTCQISKNIGRGIYVIDGRNLQIQNCMINENTGCGYGFGIYIHDSIVTIQDSFIKDNRFPEDVLGFFGPGGGIYASESSLTLLNCRIEGNTVGHYKFAKEGTGTGGGGICSANSNLTVTNTLIRNNSADFGGGALVSGISKFTNCTVVDNFLLYGEGIGGGIYFSEERINEQAVSGDHHMVNNLLVNNTQKALVDRNVKTLELRCNDFYNNALGDYFNTFTSLTLTGADAINTLPNALGNLDGDPLFVAGRYGNYYLSQKSAGQSVDSPCVDAGSDTAANLKLDTMFTRTDGGLDTGLVDIGRHYSAGGLAENYKLTVNVNGGHGTISPSSGFYASNSVVQLKALPEAHYYLKKWNGTDNDSSTATTNEVTMLMDRTVSVEFEFGYQIRMQIEGQGSISTGINRTYFTPGEQATLQAVPKEGWMFDHWAGELSGTSNPISFNVHNDMTVQAVFIKRSVLSILKIGEGTITRKPSLSAYPANSRVTLTAVPASGWSFRKWSGDIDSSSFTVMILLDTDKSIQAEFVPDGSQSNLCPLSVFVAGKGSVSPFGGAFTRNSPVTLTAMPEKGWKFVRWAGDLEAPTKITTLTVTMDRAKTLTAVFEEERTDGIVIPDTDDLDDLDDPQTDETPSNDVDNDDSVTTDIMNSCSMPAMVILLAMLGGFMGLHFERRK